MTFIAEKDPGLIPQVLSSIMDECVNGISLSDPDLDDMPIVYVNKAFVAMTGYSNEETVGKNCRFLQGDDREQEGRYKIREAIDNAQEVEVVLRNYRKNGELFYNRLKITPLLDRNGRVIYFLGVQYDITEQIKAEQEIKELNDRLQQQDENT